MKLVIIIGTRPQYIKFKPLHDYFIKKKVEFVSIDTDQHYDYNLSGIFLSQLGLKIDRHLNSQHSDSFSFFSDSMIKIKNELSEIRPDYVLVLGDTNSSLIASLVSYQLGIKVAHIEAGIRCGDKSRPEEMNRILVDDIADFHFISRKQDAKNVSNPIYVGDLEYYFLNELEKNKPFKIEFGNWLLMTIHRQENTTVDRINHIFDECKKSYCDIIFPIHPRTKKIIEQHNIDVPKNIKIIEPLGYFEMLDALSKCKGVITDSGGVSKIAPFFGKKCLIPSMNIEWDEIIDNEYALQGLDFSFFDGLYANCGMARDTKLYYNKNACKIIVDTLRKAI
ncbi:MAG: UDP-N-acetylglucosamine 2-epimerase [Phenylobacterium sp.]